MNVSEQVAQALLAVGAVGFTPKNPVTFKSGILSPVYIDSRRLPFSPAQWHIVVEAFQHAIRENEITFDLIAGIAVAGIPHSAVLGYTMGLPSIFVRKATKDYGKQQRIEGGIVTDQRVLLVEDMVTTGTSSLSGVYALRESGAIVTDCLAIISYGLPESLSAFSNEQVKLHALTSFSRIWTYAKPTLPIETITAVEAWQADPHNWKPA